MFTDGDIGRMFATCLSCKRVMPHYHAVFTVGERKRIGCVCGGTRFSPANIPLWQQVYWLFLRGWLIRKVLQRKVRWDPRLPIRMSH